MALREGKRGKVCSQKNIFTWFIGNFRIMTPVLLDLSLSTLYLASVYGPKSICPVYEPFLLFMIAVIHIGGHQYIVQKDSIIEVDHQNLKEGDTLNTEALLVSDTEGVKTQIGTPRISGSTVTLKVLGSFQDTKIRVFKMKSKKRSMRTFGFRAQKTKLQVISIA